MRFCINVFLAALLLANTTWAKSTYLRVHIESEPKTLDPAYATGVREFLILQALFEGLTRYNPQTLKPLPGVAEKWIPSPDGLRYVFHLRPNAKWSDGKPVTAQDFWNSWERLLNPKTQSPYAFQLFYLKGAESYSKGELKDPKQIGMRVLAPTVFEVLLERPVPYFLSLTSFSALAPIRKEAVKPHLINNGPFVFQAQNAREGILLTPNVHYWGKNEVRLAGVQFRPFGNFATALKFYGRTGIDILADLHPQQVPLLKFRHDFRSFPILRTEYFIINCKRPPFDKREVRQAMALSLNRAKITNNILKRGDLPYGFLIPPGMPGYQNPVPPQEFDVDQAREKLKAAGFGADKPFPTFQILHDNASDRKLVAEAAQKMWKENLNLPGQLSVKEWESYLKDRQSKNYDVSWGGWVGDYVDPNTFLELFMSDNRQNHTGWSNAEYDALLHKARQTMNTEERAGLYARAERILLDEAPIVPVLVKVKNYLIQPYVKGYFPNLLDIHPLRDVYSLRP